MLINSMIAAVAGLALAGQLDFLPTLILGVNNAIFVFAVLVSRVAATQRPPQS